MKKEAVKSASRAHRQNSRITGWCIGLIVLVVLTVVAIGIAGCLVDLRILCAEVVAGLLQPLIKTLHGAGQNNVAILKHSRALIKDARSQPTIAFNMRNRRR